MKLLVLSLLSFFIISHYSTAQSPIINAKKYEAYKNRFFGDSSHIGFIQMGTGPGTCIPLGGRIPQTDCDRNWHMLEYKCHTRKGNGLLDWGDGTIYLGLLIGVLATEYRHRLNQEQATDSIAKKLWQVLEAFDRLDKNAETFLGMEADLNGFFIRDDVPPSFHLGFDTSQYHCTKSAASCGQPSTKDGTFVSQDQLFFLLIGWSLVAELIPNERYAQASSSFGEKVAAQADRVVDYLIQHNWLLIAPDGSKVPNLWGGDARALSYGLATGANRIAGPYTKKDYRVHTGLGKAVFSTLSWLFPQMRHNKWMVLESASLVNAWSPKKFDRHCLKWGVLPWSLLDAIVNDRKLSTLIKKEDLNAILNSAPMTGPCFKTPGCQAVDGWKSSIYWLEPKHHGGNPFGIYSEYCGLDYMLIYNLYQLYYDSSK